jgi:hypothetical protein
MHLLDGQPRRWDGGKIDCQYWRALALVKSSFCQQRSYWNPGSASNTALSLLNLASMEITAKLRLSRSRAEARNLR